MPETPAELLDQIGREPLRITDVRVTPLTFKPADGSYIHICGPVVLTKMDAGVVYVETDRGITGIGPVLGGHDADMSHLVGCNPFDVDRLALPPGVDVACWDLIGKAKNRPVFELLAGGARPDPALRVYASGGVMWTYYDRGDGQPFGVDQLIAEALEYQRLGFDTFKWRPGTDWEEAGVTPKELGEICRQLRAAVGPDFGLGLEKKGYDTWTLDECFQIAPILDELEFLFFEQPMGDEGQAQFDDYLALKELMPRVMLWGGERFRSLDEATPWIEAGIYDAVQTDCVYIGLTENWRIAQKAAQHGTLLVTHNWATSLGTACNAHVVAGTEAGYMCEFFLYPNDMRYGLLKEPPRPENGALRLSDRPGLGVEVIDAPETVFPLVPGPNTLANPRFPHAWERARRRERRVAARYAT